MATFDFTGPAVAPGQDGITLPSGTATQVFDTGGPTNTTVPGGESSNPNLTINKTGDQPANGPTEQTAASKNTLSNGDLPWAIVTMPTTSAGQGGIGSNRHSLQPETWVIGFFADGENGQQPIITSVIPGGPGAGSGRGDGVGGTGSGDGSGTTTPDGNAGGENARKAFELLKKHGFTAEQAAGIVGNLIKESNVNPGITNPNDRGKAATGIAQWRGERRDALMRFGNGNTLEGQVAFLVHELRTQEKTAMRLLQNAKSPKDAAIAFANFERFAGWNGRRARLTGGQGYDLSNSDLQQRIGNAQSVYNKYGQGGGGTTPGAAPLTVTPSPPARPPLTS